MSNPSIITLFQQLHYQRLHTVFCFAGRRTIDLFVAFEPLPFDTELTIVDFGFFVNLLFALHLQLRHLGIPIVYPDHKLALNT